MHIDPICLLCQKTAKSLCRQKKGIRRLSQEEINQLIDYALKFGHVVA
jgi:hypothetical protein